MCIQAKSENHANPTSPNWRLLGYYALAIALAVMTGMSDIAWLQGLATMTADIFINMFRCISLPIIAVSIIVTLTQYNTETTMPKIWKRTLLYTLTTTVIAASIACLLYLLIKPASINHISETSEAVAQIATANNYFNFIVGLVPNSILAPFLEQQVMSVLLLGIIVGIATRSISNTEARNSVINLFKGIHEILLTITSWIVKIVPLAIYGFIAVTIMQLKNGVEISGLWAYLSIIVLANLIQGFIILPLWLLSNGIKPMRAMHGMLPALSLAFFTKSSSGTLPVTIKTAEQNMGVDPKITRLVLPLCTTINMNGCAAFIFVTVMYLMQNHGANLTLPMMFGWIFISTIAAIGNAGIPMGCFFLSASLLASMNVPITILGLILPLYSLIDMLETALNVWSDACIAKVVDHKEKELNTETESITNTVV